MYEAVGENCIPSLVKSPDLLGGMPATFKNHKFEQWARGVFCVKALEQCNISCHPIEDSDSLLLRWTAQNSQS